MYKHVFDMLICVIDMASLTRDCLGIMMLARDEKSGRGLTDEELRDEVLTLMFAGHEVRRTVSTMCILIAIENIVLWLLLLNIICFWGENMPYFMLGLWN